MKKYMRELGLLIGKNFLVQRRQKLWTVFELLSPILLTAILIILRQQVDSEREASKTYKSFPVYGDYKDLVYTEVDGEFILPHTLNASKFALLFSPTVISVTRGNTTYYPPPTMLYYAPNTSASVSVLMKKIASKYSQTLDIILKVVLGIKLQGFASEKEAVDEYLTTDPQKNFVLGAIIFHDVSENTVPRRYTIRMANTMRNRASLYQRSTGQEKGAPTPQIDFTWDTGKMYPVLKLPGPRNPSSSGGGPPGYWKETFLSLQRAIDTTILDSLDSGPSDSNGKDKWEFRLERLPAYAYVNDFFVLVIQRDLPLVLMVSFVISVLYITKNVIEEKEKRLKEYMKVMGLKNSIHWVAHFVVNLAKLSIPCMIITILLCVSNQGKKVLDGSSPTLVFIFLMLYAGATITFSFAVSSFFKKGNTGAAVGGVVWFILFVPYFFLQPHYTTMTLSSKIGSSLFLNTAMAWGAQIIGIFEGKGDGVQWSTFFIPGAIDDNLSMAHVFGMLVLNMLISLLVCWYVEGISPGDQGIPLKPWFPFMPSYWLGKPNEKEVTNEIWSSGEDERRFESTQGCGQPHVQILNLSKRYAASGFALPTKFQSILIKLLGQRGRQIIKATGSKKVNAVQNLSLSLFPGQVTALLGQNGAGKSTTVSMLTGLIPSSSGLVKVQNSKSIRSELGLCPQYNVLFQNLTVLEHLIFFRKLKGKERVKGEEESLLAKLNLLSKKDCLAGTLSGGMKRKLSLGIALVGGSKIVILDEPTSGIDPSSRHGVWALIQQAKSEGRTILLTTHYMEEADLLGDRLAILAKGRLECYGTSLFLKTLYGGGYTLSVSFGKNTGIRADRRSEKVFRTVKQNCASAVLQGDTTDLETRISIPETDKHRFPQLFQSLEEQQATLEFTSLGVSAITMEDVFLKVVPQNDEHDPTTTVANNEDGLLDRGFNLQTLTGGWTDSNRESRRMTIPRLELQPESGSVDPGVLSDLPLRPVKGWRLFALQLKASLVKRMLHSMRNWKVTMAQLFIPTLLLIFAILVNKRLPSASEAPELTFNLEKFVDNRATLFNGSAELKIAEVQEQFDRVVERMKNTKLEITNKNVSAFMNEKYRIDGISDTDHRYIVGGSFACPEFGNCAATGYFNNEPYHGPPIIANMITNTLLLNSFPNTSMEGLIETRNHPLPPSKKDELFTWLASGIKEFNIAFNLDFGMAFLASTFLVFLVREREVKSKHLQMLSGLHPASFWFATFLWDMVNYFLVAILILLTLVAFQEDQLIYRGNWRISLLILLGYGWAMLPLMYAASFAFRSASGAFVSMTIFGIVFGSVMMVVTTILYFLNLRSVFDTMQWIFIVISPNYNLGQGFNVFYMNSFVRDRCQGLEDICSWYFIHKNNSLDWEHPGIGRQVAFLGIQGVVFWILVALLELGLLQLLTRRISSLIHTRFKRNHFTELDDRDETFEQAMPNSREDRDVEEERVRVSQLGGSSPQPLVVQRLCKAYGDFCAVSGLDFAVEAGECFGLLGVNGAGKTSTFQMITGENEITAGNVFIAGSNIQRNLRKVGKLMGYCPQFDALIEELTGAESLRMFGNLRGLSAEPLEIRIAHLLRILGISQYADAQVKTYSGGTKRKLSLAVGLIGDPSLLLLDEPTSGVDPSAKRLVWSVLSNLRKKGTAIVLTSHSMEECEALCTRLGIMVAGNFRCMGPPLHLKDKFGKGFCLQMKLRQVEEVERAISKMEQYFPGSIIKIEGKEVFGPKGWLSCLSPVFFDICCNELSVTAREGTAFLTGDRYEDFIALLQTIVPNKERGVSVERKFGPAVANLAKKYLIYPRTGLELYLDVMVFETVGYYCIRTSENDELIFHWLSFALLVPNLSPALVAPKFEMLRDTRENLLEVKQLAFEHQNYHAWHRAVQMMTLLGEEIELSRRDEQILHKVFDKVEIYDPHDEPDEEEKDWGTRFTKKSILDDFPIVVRDHPFVLYAPTDVLALSMTYHSSPFNNRPSRPDKGCLDNPGAMEEESYEDVLNFLRRMDPTRPEFEPFDIPDYKLETTHRLSRKFGLDSTMYSCQDSIAHSMQQINPAESKEAEKKLLDWVKVWVREVEKGTTRSLRCIELDRDEKGQLVRKGKSELSIVDDMILPLIDILAEYSSKNIQALLERYISSKERKRQDPEAALDRVQATLKYLHHSFLKSTVLVLAHDAKTYKLDTKHSSRLNSLILPMKSLLATIPINENVAKLDSIF